MPPHLCGLYRWDFLLENNDVPTYRHICIMTQLKMHFQTKKQIQVLYKSIYIYLPLYFIFRSFYFFFLFDNKNSYCLKIPTNNKKKAVIVKKKMLFILGCLLYGIILMTKSIAPGQWENRSPRKKSRFYELNNFTEILKRPNLAWTCHSNWAWYKKIINKLYLRFMEKEKGNKFIMQNNIKCQRNILIFLNRKKKIQNNKKTKKI